MKQIMLIIIISILLFNCNENTKSGKDYGSFSNNKEIDISILPLLHEGGVDGFIEIDDNIPSTSYDKSIYFSSVTVPKSIYLINFDNEFDKLEIYLDDNKGYSYSNIYNKGNISFIKEIVNEFNTEKRVFNIPVIKLSFYDQAFLNGGIWSCSISMNNELVLKQDINVEIEGPSIINDDIFNPLLATNSFTFNRNEEVAIYDNNHKKNKNIIVAIYFYSKINNNSGISDLKPIIATRVKSDKNGKIKIKYKIGNDMPIGNYLLVTGEKIKSPPIHSHGLFTIK